MEVVGGVGGGGVAGGEGRQFNQTCYFTCPHVKGMREQHYFSVRPSFRASVVRPSVRLAISSKTIWRNSTKLASSNPRMVRVCESKLFFQCVRPSVRRSICLSRYLLLNCKAEFNQTCFITSPHGKGVREQHYFSVCPSVHASGVVHLSITVISETTGRNVTKLKPRLHALSLPLEVYLPLGVKICPSLLNTLVGKWLHLYVF